MASFAPVALTFFIRALGVAIFALVFLSVSARLVVAADLSLATLHRATPLRIIDGDTFVVRIEIWSDIFITPHIRLRGVDAPELPPRSRCAGERISGERAKARLRILVGEGVILRNASGQKDRYGRVLTEVIIDKPFASARKLVGRSISRQLLKEGLAIPYATPANEKQSHWCR